VRDQKISPDPSFSKRGNRSRKSEILKIHTEQNSLSFLDNPPLKKGDLNFITTFRGLRPTSFARENKKPHNDLDFKNPKV
jgi:hypothetical protein